MLLSLTGHSVLTVTVGCSVVPCELGRSPGTPRAGAGPPSRPRLYTACCCAPHAASARQRSPASVEGCHSRSVASADATWSWGPRDHRACDVLGSQLRQWKDAAHREHRTGVWAEVGDRRRVQSLPQWSHTGHASQQSVTAPTRCLSGSSSPRVFTGGGSRGASARHAPKSQTAEGERVPAQPPRPCRRFRPPEALWSHGGGNPPEVHVPRAGLGDSTGPAAPARRALLAAEASCAFLIWGF